jgi:glyoxylase-like metal-dependent hydrolase (beta-lactamase superfamily II)
LVREELSDGVTVFTGRHPLSGIGVTSTVVSSGKQAFVFDTLYYPDDSQELLRTVKSMGLNPVGLLNTHWHVDHTAGNQVFLQTRRIVSNSLCIDLMHTDLPAQVESLNRDLKEEDRVRPVYPNETIGERSTLTIGNREIHFLHTPGHTPDSVLGYLEDDRIAIAGDTVMEIPFIPYGDSRALKDSLMRLRPVIGGMKIIQGHGGICSGDKLNGDVAYIEVQRDS